MVLIFISLLISCFKYINAFENKKKLAAPAPATPAPTPAPAAMVQEEELVDDLELVAVITAAIAAFDNTVSAPMPGKILAVKASAGQAVKKGDVIMVLEAMKMENDIVAPQDGTIAAINVAVGDSVEPGAALATMN